jgi:hypothetical protein
LDWGEFAMMISLSSGLKQYLCARAQLRVFTYRIHLAEAGLTRMYRGV